MWRVVVAGMTRRQCVRCCERRCWHYKQSKAADGRGGVGEAQGAPSTSICLKSASSLLFGSGLVLETPPPIATLLSTPFQRCTGSLQRAFLRMWPARDQRAI